MTPIEGRAVVDRDAMSFRQLVAWAWSETPPVHRNRTNLLIHVLAVPLFAIGHVLVIAGALLGASLMAVGASFVVASLGLQGFGHSLEATPPHPFASVRDFVRRTYAEQFCNFWRFLFSGRWHASFKGVPR